MAPKYILFLVLFCFISCSNNDSTLIDSNEDATDDEITDTSSTPTKFSEFNTIQYKEIQGVDSDLLSLDIFSFEDIANKHPVILWIHGGGWAIGDKTNQLQNKIPYFEALGYIFISTNYRLSPNPAELNNENRLKFPSHIEDIAASVNWIVENISDFGGDPNNIVVMGHSAGAHLAALIATNPTYLAAFNLSTSIFKGVAAFDTQAFNIPLLFEFNTNPSTETIYLNAFGTDMNTWGIASPSLNVSTNSNLPENFFVVTRGVNLRRTIQQQFADELNSNNIDVIFIDADPLTHNGVNIAIGDNNDDIITPELTIFLENAFK